MEDHAILTAAVAASSSKMQIFFVLLEIFFIAVAVGLVLYVAMVAAVVRELNKWGRDMDKRAALGEREHQERVIAFELDARRRAEDHERFMKRLNARRR